MRRFIAVTVVVLAGTTALAAPAEASSRRLTKITVYEDAVSLTLVNEVMSYDYTIRKSPSGPVIGHTVGSCTLMYVRKSDGHAITWCDDTMRFSGGTLRTFGAIDQVNAFQGVPVKLAVVGIRGRFKGFAGVREWVALAPQLVRARSDLTLWR